MATYVNLDHPQVLVQLANPSGDFDCKKTFSKSKAIMLSPSMTRSSSSLAIATPGRAR